MYRNAEVKRKTRETDIEISLRLEGTGKGEIQTPNGFFNHMPESFARHGSFDLRVKASGDVQVDDHHLVEDCGIVLGQAFDKALGDKKGIMRAGFFIYPMDEALATTAVDLSGRPYLQYRVEFASRGGTRLDFGLLEDFFQAFAVAARANIVIDVPYGRSDHHKAEAIFKSLARSLRMACEGDPRNPEEIPSTKGII